MKRSTAKTRKEESVWTVEYELHNRYEPEERYDKRVERFGQDSEAAYNFYMFGVSYMDDTKWTKIIRWEPTPDGMMIPNVYMERGRQNVKRHSFAAY